MSDASIGFLLAIIGSISFGAYILPRKLSRLPVIEYQFWLSIAVAPLSVLAALIAGGGLFGHPQLIIYSFLCGPLWTLGSLSYSSAVDYIGVARSTPIKNLAPVFASIYGIALFQEYTIGHPVSLAMTVGGVALMGLAAYFIGKAGAPENERALAYDVSRGPELRKKALTAGLLFSAAAAFFYGAYAIPLKYVLRNGEDPYTACAWLGLGVLLSSVVVYILRARRFAPRLPSGRELLIAKAAGSIWVVGQIIGTVAMVYIPMSISWPVTNLSTLVAVAWGVWVFKEIRLDRHIGEVLWGIALYSVGLVLLALAAPAGHV